MKVGYLVAGQLGADEQWLESVCTVAPTLYQLETTTGQILKFLGHSGVLEANDVHECCLAIPVNIESIGSILRYYFWAESVFPFRRGEGSILKDPCRGQVVMILNRLGLTELIEVLSILPALSQELKSPPTWVIASYEVPLTGTSDPPWGNKPLLCSAFQLHHQTVLTLPTEPNWSAWAGKTLATQ